MTVLQVDGPGAAEAFAGEAGGHRWQRVPPTEKRGRVQSSTVTVAVLPEPTAGQVRVEDRDLVWEVCRGTGAGGQKRNKTESTVVLTHRPSGLRVRCEASRDQRLNRATALRILRAQLWQAAQEAARAARAAERRDQVGTGMRGDKRRTVRVQDGQVADHVTGQTWRLRAYLKGEW